MKNRIQRTIPNASMIVALLALFVALTGSAYAGVKLAKNSVTTKSIKNGAVTGKKIKKRTVTSANIKNDTLTGNQINEATLASVPEAAKVAGIAGADVVTKQHVVQWNVASNRGDAPKTLGKIGPWTFTGRCEANGATNTDANVDVTSSANDTYSSPDSDLDAGETANVINYTNFAPNTRSYTTSEPYFLDPASGISVLDGDGEPYGVWVGFPGADCRFVANLAVTTP
jgi:hypothetical protein